MSDTERGLFDKYRVERLVDPAGKHDACEYFVLDPVHDPHAREAMAAYATSCRWDYPKLADDLRARLEATEGGDHR